MLKRIPYSDKLIAIGNETHSNGETCISDGHVAYGWTYQNQNPTTVIRDVGGFWVGQEQLYMNDKYEYRLAGKNLKLKNKIISSCHGELQCYPCFVRSFFNVGTFMFTPNGAYPVDGDIVSFDEIGRLLLFKDYKLKFISISGRRNDSNDLPLSFGYVTIKVNDSTYVESYCYFSLYDDGAGNKTYYIYDLDFNTKGQYHIVDGQTDTISYNYDGKIYSGVAAMEIKDDVPLLQTTEVNVYLDDLYGYGYIIAVDGLRLTIDSTDVRRNAITNGGTDINKSFQLAKTTETYLTAETADRKTVNGISERLYNGDYTIYYEMVIGTGVGTVTNVNGQLTVYDSSQNVVAYTNSGSLFVSYNGSIIYAGNGRIVVNNYSNGQWNYSIRLFVDGQYGVGGRIKVNNGRTYVYDNSTGNLIANEDSNGELFYQWKNVAQWQGPGTITTSGLTPIEYNGDFVAESHIHGGSSHITNPYGNMTITDGTLYAELDGNDIMIQDNGTTIYDGPGTITVTNLQPTGTAGVYSGTYDIHIQYSGSDALIVPGVNSDVTIYDGNGNLIVSFVSGTLTIYSGGWTYNGSGSVTTTSMVPVTWLGGWTLHAAETGNGKIVKTDEYKYGNYKIVHERNGYSYRIVVSGNTKTVYYEDKIAVDNGNGNVQISNGQGTIFNGNGNISVTLDSQNSGDYTIHLEINGFGKIVYDEVENVFVYDEYGVLVAYEDGDIIHYGNNVFVGYINVSDIITTFDNVYLYDSSDNLIGYEDDENIYVGSYAGTGSIAISNVGLQLSIKRYYIDSNGITERQYPLTWTAGTNVDLVLSDMSLEISMDQSHSRTYANDPLGLLATQNFIYAGGVHAYKDFVLSQDTNLLWRNRNSETYAMIENCYSLAYLKKKWK